MKIPLVDLKANYLSIKKEIDQAIAGVIENTSFIMGKYVKGFEEDFARFTRVKHVVGCSSGTTALHLALLAGGIQPGDEVVTVPNTFIATTECISYVGGRIQFVDVVPETALVDIDQLEKVITRKTRALIVVHLYGQMPDMKHLREIADEYQLLLIEDAAQAHAAEWSGRQPGFMVILRRIVFFLRRILGVLVMGVRW